MFCFLGKVYIPYCLGFWMRRSAGSYMSIKTSLELGNVFDRESIWADSLEFTSFAASLDFSEQLLPGPPPNVLCDGTHPIGGSPKTPILRAPISYNSLIQPNTKTLSKHRLMNSCPPRYDKL